MFPFFLLHAILMAHDGKQRTFRMPDPAAPELLKSVEVK
jgi:hypothetical protein